MKISLLLLLAALVFVSCDKEAELTPDANKKTWYEDIDQDGFGDPYVSLLAIDQPDGFVDNSDDVNDTDPDISTAKSRGFDRAIFRYQSGIKKAAMIVKSFERTKTWPLRYYMSSRAVTHDLSLPELRQTWMDMINGADFKPFDITVERGFQSKDYVVLQVRWTNADVDLVSFEVFRFERGYIVEHWNNIAPYSGVSPVNGNTQLDGMGEFEDYQSTKQNIALVEDFVEDVFVDGKWSTFSNFIEPGSLIQHNPTRANGTNFFVGRTEGEAMYSSVEFVHGKGNFVLAMSESVADEDGDSKAHFDLFRCEEGKIVEHWDIIQDIPAPDDRANENGKWNVPEEEEEGE